MLPLRRIFQLSLLAGFLSCHSPAHEDKDTESRTDLILALKDMESRMDSRDSGQIAPLFQFPIPDSVMPLYIEDSAYKVWRLTHKFMPRAAFDTLLPKILDDWDLESFKDFFRHIDYDKLTIHNSLKRTVAEPDDACQSHFEIKVEGDSLVHIFYGISDNPDWIPSSPDKQRTPNECKESVSWTLSWNGKKLLVVHQRVVD